MTVTQVVAFTLATAFGMHGVRMILAVPAMRAAAASVGFSVTQYRYIGLLELAAAIGVAAGLVYPMLGVAAGVGVIALMTVSSFSSIRKYVERLNVSRRKTSAIERRVRYKRFCETRLFSRILRNIQ